MNAVRSESRVLKTCLGVVLSLILFAPSYLCSAVFAAPALKLWRANHSLPLLIQPPASPGMFAYQNFLTL